MEDLMFQNIWNEYNQKLEATLKLNQKNAVDITKLKVSSLLSSTRPIKIFTIISGIIWSLIVGAIAVIAFLSGGYFLFASAFLLLLIWVIAIAIYIYHLVLIDEVDVNQSIIMVQEKMAKLKSSTLLVTKIIFLQLPLFTTFYWNWGMIHNGNIFLWCLQIIITGLFTFTSIWLFRNIKYENKDKKWFQWIFNDKEWNSVIKSIDMLQQIEEFKNE